MPQPEELNVFKAFGHAINQLGDPRIRRVLLLSLGATLLVYTVLIGGISWALFSTELLTGLPFWESIVDWLGVVLVPLATLFLFPAVISLMIGFFLEDVADAVEAKHYPDLPPNRAQPLAEVIWITVRFAALALLLNILVLPLFLFPIIGQVAYLIVNGYLIGREYFELVALRRLDPKQAKGLRTAHLGTLWMTGALIAFLLTVPLVNVLAPVIGVAVMVHIAHELAGRHFRGEVVA